MVSDVPSVKPLQILAGWPRRRWVAAAVLAGPLAFLYASAGGSAGWGLPVLLLTAVLAAALLASYLPGPGSRRLDTGCTPCAAIAGAAVVGSLMMRSLAPGDTGIAVVAAGMVAFGLGQRLSGAVSCPTPR